MARTDVETLVVQMSADLKQFERAFAKASGTTTRELRKIERQSQASVSKIENVFSRFGTGFIAGLGIGSIAEIGRTIQQAVSQAAKIGDLSDKIGLSTDSLQALQLGAAQADLSFEDLDKTLLRFSKTLGEAANGQGEYLKTLRANDQQLKGTFFENLKQLADLVKNAKNEQEALLIITQAMGKGSDEWLEVLRKGSDGIRQLGDEARTAGAIVDESLIKEAQRLDDSWAKLMTQLGTYTKTFAVEAAKALGGIFANAQKLSDSLRAGSARQFFFGNSGGLSGAIGNALLGPDQTLAPEDPLMRQPRGTREKIFARPVEPTKISNPEVEAEKRRKLAEALREEKRAREELVREIEREFQAFTAVLSRTDEQTEAMELEAATLGQSTSEIERQRIALELLNEARQNGIPITDDLNAVIQQSAAAYGDAAQKLEDLQKQQEINEEITSQVKDSFKGFITDIASGVEPVEALTNALGRLADRLLDLALDNVLNSLLQPSGTAGGGGLGGLLANVLHGGGVVGAAGGRRAVSPLVFAGARRMHSGGIAGDEVAAILQKGEIVLPKGTRAGGGGSVEINVSNPPGTRTERRERREGGRTIIDIVNSAVDTRLASQSTDKLFAAKFGMRPVVKRH